MSKIAKYIIVSLCGLLLAGGLVGAYLWGSICREQVKCTGLSVTILDSTVNRFVTRADVEKFLNKEYGNYIGQHIDSIDLCKVEKIIDSRSAVYKS